MFLTEPAGKEGDFLHRQETVNLIGLFPLALMEDGIYQYIRVGGFRRHVPDHMKGVFRRQEKKTGLLSGVQFLRHGAMFPLLKILRGSQKKPAVAVGVEQMGSFSVMAQGKVGGGAFNDLFRCSPSVPFVMPPENAALFVVKKMKVIFGFQIFHMRILHAVSPEIIFITVYARK